MPKSLTSVFNNGSLADESITKLSRSALLRNNQFRTQGKAFGPLTAQAFAEGQLRAEAAQRSDDVFRQEQLNLDRERFEETQRFNLESQRQSREQFREGLKEDRRQFDLDIERKRRARKNEEKGFIETLTSFCFITTAVCKSQGKPDNCHELEVLRKYRDTWLKENHPGEIDKYYKIAPDIVMAIDDLDNSDEIWNDIYENSIEPCVTYVECGQNKLAYEEYKSMVDGLMEVVNDG
jgi:hypothetical protein